MKIACIGGGPAGLYFAISMKLREQGHEIEVFERNPPGVTFGWGVVFSDMTVDNISRNDPSSAQKITDEFAHWDDIDVHYRGETITSGGHGFIGIGRKRLLEILQDRARELGVVLHFDAECDPADAKWSGYDLVIAADGGNSRFRDATPNAFGMDIDVRRNKFVWLGTSKVFEAFTFAFEETEHGWIWAHAYRFAPDCSTFIVECSEESWTRFGFDRMDQHASIATCERIFGKYLDGHRLQSNAAHLAGPAAWLNFRRIKCEQWSSGNVILLGDAAHTAHFSIGSGTKLALEDAIKLAEVLNRPGLSVKDALGEYQAERNLEVLKLQNSARNSTEWFETLERYAHFEPLQFAYSLLTRSQRISHENLRLRDRDWLEGVERWFWKRATDGRSNKTAPPMFAPFKLRDMEVANRITVSPMAMYSAVEGVPNDFHLVHLGERALGGAGLVFTEMVCVSADARISPGCAGLYAEPHRDAWRRIVDYVHGRTPAKIALQLGHAGPKGSTQRGWEAPDEPLPVEGDPITGERNWPLIAPSPIAYGPRNQRPHAMTRDDMVRVRSDFARAARWGAECGFDWLELHCAHGYLLSAFLCPLTNRRDDDYGGSIENRCRYPLEVFAALRAVWPAERPMSVRISAHDWAPGGNTPDDAVVIARLFREAGADLIDVSSGQTTRDAKPVYGRMYQTPFADRIRNEVGIATMAVGAIFEPDHVNSIVMAGRADLCAIARPHLADPYWTLHAAAALGYRAMPWPVQYLSGKAQLERNLERAQAMALERPEANG